MRALKEKLRAGGTVSVCNPDFPTPRLVEFVGGLGFDAVFIDCEHAPTGFALVDDVARAARLGGMATIVRPSSHDEGLINRYLSCGADGIQVPHVDSRAEAEAILQSIARWEGDHTEKLVVAMIESEAGVAALPAMLELPEIDVFYIGGFDLALSMGLKGNPGHPRVRALVEQAITTIAGAGRVAGMNVQGDLEAVGRYRALGLRWFNVHLKAFVARGAGAFLDSVRAPS